MLDILLSRLKEEIAVDGSSGSCIDQVWEYAESILKGIAEESGTLVTPVVDERYKAFLWNHLKSEDSLEFYENIATQVPNLEVESTVQVDTTTPEMEEEVLELLKKVESTSTGKKRKTPPKSKVKPKPKKKTSTKTKKATKMKKKVVAGDSDDDYEAAEDSPDSSSDSEFEQDTDDLEESDELQSEAESDGYGSNDNAPARKKHASAVQKTPKAPTTKQKKNRAKPTLRSIDQVSNLTYEEMLEKYGEKLYVTGSIELQEKQLYIGIPPGANLSPNLVVILQEILKTRNRGLLQADITKILGIDSRSTGHYCKSLEEKGAIVRNGVSTHKMRTNSCVHARYANKQAEIEIDEDDNDVPYNVNSKGVVYSQSMLHDSLIELMKDAPNFLITSEDVLRALGFQLTRRAVRKWYNRTINELCEKGHIMKTNVKIAGYPRPRRCIKLLRTPESVNIAYDFPVEEYDYPLRIKSNRNDIPILSFPVDCSLESQLSQVLMAAGENGCTQKELEFALNTDNNRVIYKLLEKMCEMTDIALERFGAVRLLEFEGKLRRYRYYTYAAFKKVHENIDFVLQPIPDEDSLGFTLKEKEIFVDVPHTLRLYQKFMLQSRKDLGLMKKTKTLADGTVVPYSSKPGRPKKTPESSETPKKRGRPKKSAVSAVSTKTAPAQDSLATVNSGEITSIEVALGTPEAIAAESSNTVISAEPPVVNMDVDVNTANNPQLPAIIEIDAEVAQVTDSNELPINPETEKITPAINPTAGNVTPAINPTTENVTPTINPTTKNVTPAINPTIENVTCATNPTMESVTPHLSDTANTPPAANLTRRRRSLSITEDAPSKKSKHTNDDNSNDVSTATPSDVTDSTSQPEGVTVHTAIEVSAPSSVPIARPTGARKRTIADYFTKLPRTSAEQTPVSSPQSDARKDLPESNSISEESDNNSQFKTVEATPASIEHTGTAMDIETAVAIDENSISETSASTAMTTIESSDNAIQASKHPKSALPGEYVLNPEDPVTANSISENPVTESFVTENSTSESNVTAQPIVGQSESREPRNWIANFKKGSTHRNKQINIYMEIRMKVLLAVLEDYPMWEIGKDLKDAYIRKATELSGPPKYTVCNKTLWRSATTLAERGEAAIDVVECTLLTGTVLKRKIFLHKNVDTQGDEYAFFKKNLRDRHAYQPQYYIAEKVATLDVPVESLEDRIARMKKQLEVLTNDGKLAESKSLELRINELSQNAQKFKRNESGNNLTSWMITGVQFGWIRARCIRIKLLYMYLFGLFTRETKIEGVDKENRTITMSAVVANFPLNLYCNIFGIFDLIPAVVEYVRNPENTNVTYQDMPNHIREELFSNRSKFRRRIRSLFHGLEYLGLITGLSPTVNGFIEAEKYVNLAAVLRLEQVGVIREVKKLGQPIVREHILNTMTDATLFWSELQYISTHVDAEIPPENQEPEPTNPIERELWRGFCNIGQWSNASVYSRSQRKVLNAYVDKVKGTTPLKNYSICADIADELNTSVTYVRRYFAKVEVAIERKNLDRQEKALARRLKPTVRRPARRKFNRDFEGRRVVNLSSTRAFHPVVHAAKVYPKIDLINSTNATVGAEDEQDREVKRDLFLDRIDDAPELTSDTISMRLKRRTRQPWPAEDDELLIYSYVILRHRSTSRSAFRWTAIQQVFPTRDTNQCRNRLRRMLTDVVYMEQLETATNLWNRFFIEGIQKGEIENADPREMVKFDLLSHLTYFLKRLNDGGPLYRQSLLPANVADIDKHYSVNRSAANANPYYHEDRFFNAPTLITKMGTLYHQSLSVRRVQEKEYDVNYSKFEEDSDADSRTVNLLKVFSMMCLLSPAETYDPFYAHYAISTHSEDLLQTAVDEMRSDGVLIVAKYDREIPNTKYGLSAKMSTLMAGKLPQNLLVQASEYYKYLREQNTSNRFTPEFVSSGMMACLLGLLSENKLDVRIANKSSKMKSIENAHFHSRQRDRSLIALDLDLQVSNDDETKTTNSVPLPPDLKHVSKLEFDIQFNDFTRTQPENLRKLLHRIADIMEVQKDKGLNLYLLKQKIDGQVDDDEILHAVGLLEQSDPPMLVRVGFESSRYVLSPFISTWTISNQAISSLSKNVSRKGKTRGCEHLPDTSDFDRKDVITIKLWNDVNGFTTDLVLKDCKNVIVDYILRRPGSSEANIYRNFSIAFSRANLQELLQLLVDEKTLKKVHLTQQNEVKARKSIFSKSCTSKCTPKPVIEKATQTCYWVVNPYH